MVPYKCNVLTSMPRADGPSRSTMSGVRLTMQPLRVYSSDVGVVMVPWGVIRVPLRALPSLSDTWKDAELEAMAAATRNVADAPGKAWHCVCREQRSICPARLAVFIAGAAGSALLGAGPLAVALLAARRTACMHHLGL